MACHARLHRSQELVARRGVGAVHGDGELLVDLQWRRGGGLGDLRRRELLAAEEVDGDIEALLARVALVRGSERQRLDADAELVVERWRRGRADGARQRGVRRRCCGAERRLQCLRRQHGHGERAHARALGPLQGHLLGHQVAPVASQLEKAHVALAQLLLLPARVARLEREVDVRLLLVFRAQRLLQRLLRAAPRRHADAVAVAEVERGRRLALRLGPQLRRARQVQQVHLHPYLRH
eukprot:scaffold57714_cov66-Phaeocystis_antarctica.AAC.1